MFKIKNFIMHLIISPLLIISGIFMVAFLGMIVSCETMSGEVNYFVSLVLFPGIGFGTCYLALKLKGKQVDTTEWVTPEYEINYTTRTLKQVKGGWTKTAAPIVTFYFLISPIFIVTQVIALILSFISLFSKRIFSCYCSLNLNELNLKARPLQKILFFLFDIIIIF